MVGLRNARTANCPDVKARYMERQREAENYTSAARMSIDQLRAGKTVEQSGQPHEQTVGYPSTDSGRVAHTMNDQGPLDRHRRLTRSARWRWLRYANRRIRLIVQNL